jgi:hypothetical protein
MLTSRNKKLPIIDAKEERRVRSWKEREGIAPLLLFLSTFTHITRQLGIVSQRLRMYLCYQRGRLQNEKRTNGTVVFLCAYSNYGQTSRLLAFCHDLS